MRALSRSDGLIMRARVQQSNDFDERVTVCFELPPKAYLSWFRCVPAIVCWAKE